MQRLFAVVLVMWISILAILGAKWLTCLPPRFLLLIESIWELRRSLELQNQAKLLKNKSSCRCGPVAMLICVGFSDSRATLNAHFYSTKKLIKRPFLNFLHLLGTLVSYGQNLTCKSKAAKQWYGRSTLKAHRTLPGIRRTNECVCAKKWSIAPRWCPFGRSGPNFVVKWARLILVMQYVLSNIAYWIANKHESARRTRAL